MTRFDLVIVGSGPGGSSAAIAAAKRGRRVLIIERGPQLGSGPGKRSLGQLLNAIKNLDDYAPRVAGGGSAINYGVVATPTASDIESAVGAAASRRVRSRFENYMQDVGRPQAAEPEVGPVHRQIALAFQAVWGARIRTDQALDDERTEGPRATNEETLLYSATAQPDVGYRRDQLSIALQLKNVTLWTESHVDWIRDGVGVGSEDTVWSLQVSSPRKRCLVEAGHLLIACGALETPRLLLVSKQGGHLPRGISAHVGQHLVDHRRNEVILRVRPGYTTTRYNRIPVLVSHNRTHVQVLHYSGIESLSIATANCAGRMFGCRTSRALDCIPPCLVFDEAFSDRTFDAFCCAPLGLAATFNPCRCVSDRVLFVVGMRTSVEGSVTIDSRGRRKTLLPQYSGSDIAAVQETIGDITQKIVRLAPALLPDSAPTELAQSDTQWHYGGTVRSSTNGDGAVDADFRVLDGQGRPYETLFVADNSVMRVPSTFNTQTMAALIGYCGGAAAVEHMERG